MSAEAAGFLRTLPLFASLSDAEVAELAWTAQPFRLETGEFLCRQGAGAEEMYCIESGRVALSVMVGGTDENIIGYRERGCIVGETALVDGGIRSASVRATEPTCGWSLHRRGLDVLRATHRPSAAKVLRQIAGIISDRIALLIPAPQMERSIPAPAVDLAPLPMGWVMASVAARVVPEHLTQFQSGCQAIRRGGVCEIEFNRDPGAP